MENTWTKEGTNTTNLSMIDDGMCVMTSKYDDIYICMHT